MTKTLDNALRLRGVNAGYGKKAVLSRIDLYVRPGELVAIIGHNGAGKTTLIKSIVGLATLIAGEIEVFGDVLKRPSPRILRLLGVGYVPQGNRVIGDLTVLQNLELGSLTLPHGIDRSDVLRDVSVGFPLLVNRSRERAGLLSGGERQVVALASALMTRPRLMLLDEPSLGLSPKAVDETLVFLRDYAHKSGTAVLVVEQKVRQVLNVCDRVYSVKAGQIVFSGTPNVLQADIALLKKVFL